MATNYDLCDTVDMQRAQLHISYKELTLGVYEKLPGILFQKGKKILAPPKVIFLPTIVNRRKGPCVSSTLAMRNRQPCPGSSPLNIDTMH
jgi:hypothetical protein